MDPGFIHTVSPSGSSVLSDPERCVQRAEILQRCVRGIQDRGAAPGFPINDWW